jgi:hypothetical protein
MTSDRARELAQRLVVRADVLLQQTAASDEVVPSGRHRADGLRLDGRLPHPAVALFLNVIVVSSVAEAVIAALTGRSPEPAGFGPVLLRIVTVWALAFTPGWIFVRFLGQRMSSLWDEYVVNLHRLGWDRPENLPPPPLASRFFDRWQAAGGEVRSQKYNIYREKFDAYYGFSSSGTALDRLHRARIETLVPVFVLTALLSVCWAALLWDLHKLTFSSGVVKLWTCFAFGFLGAYAFGVNMLVRRFLRSDLRISAYANFALRIIVVLLLALGVHPLLNYLGADAKVQAAVMVLVGIFPLSSLQAMRRLASSWLRTVIPSMRPPYKLSDLDGMSVWYESRLLEEGIEDMQSLVTANLVDVVLFTRLPIARLIDWIDQSLLLLHFDRSNPGLKEKFRQLGIRTATDLLTAFPPAEMDSTSKPTGSIKTALGDFAHEGVDATEIRNLVRILQNQPGLTPVRNWKSDGLSQPTTVASAGRRAR